MFKRRTPSPAQKQAFGKMIHSARKDHGYTQEQLAEFMDCSVRWIIRMEEGTSSPNNMDTLRLMAILEISVEQAVEEVCLDVRVLAH